MDTTKILSAVDKLHANAVRQDQITIQKITYYFNFNGTNYVVTSSDKKIDLVFNTRKINEAKKWLRDYLRN